MKVNDELGNPIEIAVVPVWEVKDTTRTLFEVDDYIQYVEVQSEAAVRHLVNLFAYDSFEIEEAARASNLLVVLGGEKAVSPIVNTGAFLPELLNILRSE